MYVETHGSGDRLVLLHGIGDTHATWAPVVGALARERTVHVVDLPGFGASPRLPLQSVPELARAVADEIGGTFHVAGSSLGGRIGFELAEMGVARSLTAISPAGFGRGIELRWARVYLTAYHASARLGLPLVEALAGRPGFRRIAGAAMFVHGERIPAADLIARARSYVAEPEAYFDTFEAATGDHVTRAPGDVPVTVAWGTRDTLLPYFPQAARARKILPAARHVALPGAGHLAMVDAPERIVELILATSAEDPVPAERAGTATTS